MFSRDFPAHTKAHTKAHSARLKTAVIAAALPGLLAAPLATPIATADTDPTDPTDTVITPAPREHAPNTDSCPQATWPPEAVSTSERIAPGSPTPTPLPVTYDGPCGVIAPDGFTVSDDVLATAWLVADIDTGDVIAMKDPHGRYRPASIIKALLALVVIEELPLDKKVTVSDESAGQEGSAVGLGGGGEYTVGDLLHGLLMVSGNDAAHALAQALGGDEKTLKKVNAKAAELGMKDTRAASYSGLDAPGMSTSAWDMGLAYRAAYANPVFTEIISTESYPFPGYTTKDGTVYEDFDVWNDNNLYLNDPDGIGGKTGFTDDAKHTFVGALDRNGRRIMAIVLDTTVDRARAWEQTQQLIHEGYKVPRSKAVASLIDVSAPTTPSPNEEPPASDGESPPWEGIAVLAAVIALAGVGTWFSVASKAKARRRQQRQ
ncbi:D-alanyl-D-alanine carboxypeptidase family protein [Corynebacterium sp. MSK044]|uniref:D-alanyl-D-alanine carboxypeptidase family protein n=1 Tax=Corynebacterium sp. MSK044 TaxID=3050195 RepID=UPI002550D2ED|nr:D-alanyl-D-alanine carboxypeptidase family protein [Corynebacterium sp. MSK044]MDK8798001.1 D-alanyl-D-alanine carboxypeptidase family protein [Corynebacterium sp. MSK044]